MPFRPPLTRPRRPHPNLTIAIPHNPLSGGVVNHTAIIVRRGERLRRTQW